LPWQGFFELIYQADCFIFLDDFQFSFQSYHQRNRLFTSTNNINWYTVPVIKAASSGVGLNYALIDDSTPWRKKMLNRLQHNYSKASFFCEIFPIVEKCLNSTHSTLADLNINFIRSVIDLFGWEREIRFSSDFQSKAIRSSRVLDLLHWCKASEYYSARGAIGYMQEEEVFPVKELDILFQDFVPASYLQIGSTDKFFPFLSVLDALFNIGKTETARLITGGTYRWHKWNEMVNLFHKKL
jgi:hypothetical protein